MEDLMPEPENEKTTEETAEKKKGGKMKLIIIVLLVVILLGGAGGGFYYWRTVVAANAAEAEPDKKSKKSSKKESEDAADKKSPKDPNDPLSNALPDDEDVKQIIELQPFIVNLADTEQARYLRMTISLGVDGEGTEKPDQIFVTRVRNAMLAVLSDKKSEEILTVEGKAKLRGQLLKAAQAVSEEPAVKAIYITDFIVQL